MEIFEDYDFFVKYLVDDGKYIHAWIHYIPFPYKHAEVLCLQMEEASEADPLAFLD